MVFQQVVSWIRALSPDVVTKGLRVLLTLVIGLLLVRLLAVVTQRSIMESPRSSGG
jgi:hypothetical protein